MARSLDHIVVVGDMALAPMYSLMTGELIEDFPSSLDQVERLNGEWRLRSCRGLADCVDAAAREVDNLLRPLGESVVGSAAQKKRNLKFAMGLIIRIHP